MPEPFDAIIVGAGAGGGTAARVLTQRGWNVLVLEKGPQHTAEDFLPFDELHFHEHKALIPHIVDDPNIYMAGPNQDQPTPVERWWIVNMVGGSTMIWDANMPRYTREDVQVLDYLHDVPPEADMVNWPWTYDELQPYFERAELEWGMSGKARQSPAQEPMRPDYDYPMPPIRTHSSTDFLMEAFDKAGMKPYLGPHAINSRTYDGRPACSYCGFNQFFGCAVNSRASSANTVLPRALATGRCELRTGHCVTRLVHENGQIRGVAVKTDPAGPETVLEAPRVFVSIQTIESARLFLISEIPDPNKLIGHYLTYHTHANAELHFPLEPVWDLGGEHQPRTAIGSLQLRDLYVIDDSATYLTKGGKFSIYDPYTWATPIRQIKSAALGPDKKNVWGDDLVAYLEELRTAGGVYFSFTGEAMSIYDNRVELDPDRKDPWGLPAARTYYRHHKYDQDLSKYALDRVCQVMVDAGGEVRRYEPQTEENPGYGHVQGSLRAGTDPGASVLDENCQSHTVSGLYVLDCSFMPTAGASNPTMTLLANAYRVCESVPKADH
jgi:choline dehydrogenase-like flavoprotein